jgi:hypothetical protein
MRTISLILLVLAACTQHVDGIGTKTSTLPDDPSGPGTDPVDPGSLTIETFIEQLDTADCAHAFSCQAQYPDDEDTSFPDAYGSDAQDCVTGDADYDSRSDYADSVDAGRITFDANAAADCLNDLQFPSTCAAYFDDYDYPQSCYDAIVGEVLPGNFCATTYDCYGYSACIAGTCSGASFVATKKPLGRNRH